MSRRREKRFLQRSRIDIMACILKHSNARSRKTHLIYKCNLSLSQFNTYAACLIEGELLEKYMLENGVQIYETTDKGKKFLDDYERIREALEKMMI